MTAGANSINKVSIKAFILKVVWSVVGGLMIGLGIRNGHIPLPRMLGYQKAIFASDKCVANSLSNQIDWNKEIRRAVDVKSLEAGDKK